MMPFRLRPEISVSPDFFSQNETKTLPIERLVPSQGLMVPSGKFLVTQITPTDFGFVRVRNFPRKTPRKVLINRKAIKTLGGHIISFCLAVFFFCFLKNIFDLA